MYSNRNPTVPFECNNRLPFSHTRTKLNRPGNRSSHHSSISPLKLTRVFDFYTERNWLLFSQIQLKCFEKSELFQSVSARNFPFPRFWADCAEFIIPYRSEHGLSEILALENELEMISRQTITRVSSMVTVYSLNHQKPTVSYNQKP